MKKTVSLFLAMIMALAVPVFAGTSTGSGGASTGSGGANSWSATASVQIPTIAVTLPSNGTVFVNPFGFTVVTASGVAATDAQMSNDSTTETSSEKIVSPVYLIKNESPMVLDVGVIASATINTGSTMTLNAVPLTEGSTKKEAFIFAQFQQFEKDKVDAATASGATADKKLKVTKGTFAYAHDAIPAVGTQGESGYVAAQPAVTDEAAAAANKAAGIVGITVKVPKEPTVIGQLAKGSTENPTYLGYQFFGDAVTNPKEAWVTSGTGADGLSVSMVFSFNPATSTT